MKRLLLCALALLLTVAAQAQFQTAGTGRRYTLAQLSTAAGAAYLAPSGTEWRLNDTIRLAATDTLSITTNETIRAAALALVYVDGTLLITPPDSVKFTAQNTAAPWHGFSFSNTSSNSRLRRTVVEYCAGLRTIGSNLQLIDCTFRRNVATLNGRLIGSGALSLSGNRALVQGCRFERNARSGIISPANGGASPIIRDCRFLANSTENGNYPQINLGPGIPTDTIFIERCLVVGGGTATNMAGGISLSNLLGGSSVSKAVIRRNIIRNNRYGVGITATSYAVYITQNLVENNNTNPNALTGGSGLNFTGTQSQTGVVSRNIIRGNLWGVTILRSGSGTGVTGGPRISFGNLASADTTNRGFNVILGNGNGGTVADLYNNNVTTDTIRAENNWWGTAVVADIEAHITHKTDDNTLGFVDYLPFRVSGPLAIRTARPLALEVYPNPARDAVTLQAPAPGRVQVSLLDAAGRVVQQRTLTATPDGRAALPLTNLKAGLYLYRAEQGGHTATGRLLVE
ncbi:T9SS type A sorting domain-containing protein [Hymenobacter jeollabukensis]|uniref:T9SS type A sorting domain-containing protein n=1 Tax=Hymenobacter jeollabukensis TaxID=2025313 RepID=A0A5R8WIT9_9BACT|nr:T9SS type A sorting domain-containing protein [Hymenobacter jeollabukensis]TLM88544.1 T9SS type A sorting domain-containing protein [Hymenobacter jeollabukensis]